MSATSARSIPRWRTACAALLVSASSLCGCSGGTTQFPGPPQVVLGTGLYRFTPILPCHRLPIVFGPQGGYHVWGSVRIRYMQPRIDFKFTLTNPDSGAVLLDSKWPPIKSAAPPAVDGGLRVGGTVDGQSHACADGGEAIDMLMAPDPGVPSGVDGWTESLGNLMLMPRSLGNDAGVLRIDGVALRARIEATDVDGRTGADEKTFYAFTPVE